MVSIYLAWLHLFKVINFSCSLAQSKLFKLFLKWSRAFPESDVTQPLGYLEKPQLELAIIPTGEMYKMYKCVNTAHLQTHLTLLSLGISSRTTVTISQESRTGRGSARLWSSVQALSRAIARLNSSPVPSHNTARPAPRAVSVCDPLHNLDSTGLRHPKK